MADNETPPPAALAAALEPCPPWCVRDHGEARPGATVHASEYRWLRDGRGPSVAILQAPGGKPSLNFDGLPVDLGDAELLAGAMKRLGHPDVAAAITEAAALATEENS